MLPRLGAHSEEASETLCPRVDNPAMLSYGLVIKTPGQSVGQYSQTILTEARLRTYGLLPRLRDCQKGTPG